MQPTLDAEAAFESYVELKVPYFEAIEANDDRPWFDSLCERRDLFMRRYVKPAPPEGLAPIKSIHSYQRSTHDEVPQQISRQDHPTPAAVTQAASAA